MEGVKAGLLYEVLPRPAMNDPAQLAAAIKSLALVLKSARPIEEAISTAGGARRTGRTVRGWARGGPGSPIPGGAGWGVVPMTRPPIRRIVVGRTPARGRRHEDGGHER